MATHLTLYRKYRPLTLAEVVGQAMPVQTLRNALARNDLAHAYLFHGPRGTGKTSLARIVARSLNCEQGLGPQPCGQCQNCADILAGRNPEVVEMDAASHSKVEEVRRLLEQLWVPRTRNRFKVYILDEVHMLSTSAFNALLKAVEEPPEGLLFILATTEPHKVPATIRSRCQEFAFARLSVADMEPALLAICQKEGFTPQPGVLRELCLASDGCMRDALSLLQQLASVTGGELDSESLRRLSGRLGEAEIKEWLSLLKEAQAPPLLEKLQDYYTRGQSLSALVKELRRFLSEQILAGENPAPWAGVVRWLDKLDQRLGLDKEPLLAVESALARLVADVAAPAPTAAAAAAPVASPPPQDAAPAFARRKPPVLAAVAAHAAASDPPAAAPAPASAPASTSQPKKPATAPPSGADANTASEESWEAFVNSLMKTDVPLMAMLSQAEGEVGQASAVVRFKAKWRLDALKKQGKDKTLEQALVTFFGRPLAVRLEVAGATPAPAAASRQSTAPAQAASSPAQEPAPAAPPRRQRPAPPTQGLPLDEGVINRILKLVPGSTVEPPPGGSP